MEFTVILYVSIDICGVYCDTTCISIDNCKDTVILHVSIDICGVYCDAICISIDNCRDTVILYICILAGWLFPVKAVSSSVNFQTRKIAHKVFGLDKF